jgi:hypothetical protein
VTGYSAIRNLLAAVVVSGLVLACASQAKTTRNLLDPAYADVKFSNFLVVAAGANYDARAQFERQLVAAIRNSGRSAAAYYTIAGNNSQITRADIGKAIAEGGFDAVLLTRVKGQENTVDVVSGAPETKTTRRSGTAFDLFRYDYEELNDPDTVEINTSVLVVTELYAAGDEKKVWAIESSASSKDGAGVLIDMQVETIIRHLRKDKLIGG